MLSELFQGRCGWPIFITRERTTPLSRDRINPGYCSPALRVRILGNTPYFRDLPAPALDAVYGHFCALDYSADTPIHHEDDPAESLLLVAHGNVKLLQHSRSGAEVVLDLLSQGDLFGGLALLGRRRYPQSAIAQTDCCVRAITTTDFRHLLRTHPDVALATLHGVAHDFEVAYDTIRAISTLPVEARIASVLLRLADRLDETDLDSTPIQSPLSQQDPKLLIHDSKIANF